MGGRLLAGALWTTTVLVLLAGIVEADRAGAAGREVLAIAAGPLEWLVERGADLFEAGRRLGGPLRIASGAGVLAWLVWSLWARRRPGSDAVAVALLVGWVATSFLLTGPSGAGIGLFGLSAAIYASRRRVELPPSHWPAPAEALAAAALVCLFVAPRLYRLGVEPDVFFDEAAYLSAARMQLGEIARGPILSGPFESLYTLERFQAQFLALFLHALAVATLAPGFLPLRLVSVVAVTVSTVVVALLVRRRLGSPAASWMLALGCFCPLSLAYSRTGFYTAVTMLHAALAFGALVRFRERRDRRAALLLGLALGSAFYLYQLSWFVPVLVAAALAFSGRGARDRVALRGFGLATGLAALLILPGVVGLRDGVGLLAAQTSAKGVWRQHQSADGGEMAWVELLAPDAEAAAGVAARADSLASESLHASALFDRAGRAVLVLVGPASEVRPVAAPLVQEGWWRLAGARATSSGRDALSILRRYFYAPGWRQRLRLVDAPLLNPVLAPLAVLGLLAAWRQRRRPVVALLLVWTLGAAFVPVLVSGAAPRRTVLILPFLQALMALPLVELGGALARRGRALAWLPALGLLLVVAATGAHLSFQRWDLHFDARPRIGSKLELARLIRSLPSDERILLPPTFPGFASFLERYQEEPPPGARRRVFVIGDTTGVDAIRRAACRQAPPYTWIAPDTETSRADLRVLEREFGAVSAPDGNYRVYRVSALPPDACPASSDLTEPPSARRAP